MQQPLLNKNLNRDFGSFQSSNVEELIHKDELSYKTPIIDVAFDPKSEYAKLSLSTKFGTDELKKKLFYLSDEFVFLNHGAFGLSFRPVVDYVQEYRIYAESQPLRFYDRKIMPLLVDIIRRFAQSVFFCNPNQLALVENCTFAFNSILNSVGIGSGDHIFIFSSTYGVYKKILKNKCSDINAHLVEEVIEFPIVDEDDLNAKTLAKIETALEKDVDKKIKIIFIDHIPSNQPFIMPIELIGALIKSKRPDVLYFVDGAHSLGSMHRINLKNIDIFITNCHKWFCGPKGTAFLYKSDNVILRPAVLSHGIGSGFNSEFIWTGLKDYSAFLGLYANLELWNNCLGGFDHVIGYCKKLAKNASEHLVSKWTTDFLVNPSLCSSMLCVRLPNSFISNVLKQNYNESNSALVINYDHAEVIQNYLYDHGIEVPVKSIQNKLYVRISCHIYNKIEDYKALAEIVIQND